MAFDAAKSRDPVRRRHLRKIAQKPRREFEAGKAVLPRGKVINQACGHEAQGQRTCDRRQRRVDGGGEEPTANAVYDDKEETP